MNKNKLIRMGVCAGIGAGVGALIGFGIDRAIKKHKNNKQEVVKEVVKEKEPNELDYAVKMVKIIFGSMIIVTLIDKVSSHFSSKSVDYDDIWDAIMENRNFNEMNFVMTVCHMCETDTTTSAAEKIVEIHKVIDSKLLGDKAVGILKDKINELMEVK